MIYRKRIKNKKGVALVYVVMATLAVAAICLTVAILATNLYGRTAAVSAQQQAMIMSKSVAQSFANEYVGSNARSYLSYLLKGFCDKCHVRYQYDTTAKKYKCSNCEAVKLDQNNPNDHVTVNCEIAIMPSETISGSTPVANFADVTINIRLSDDRQFLYGDVITNYNGASATTTLVMSYADESSFEDNMYDMFSYYNMYLTEAGGSEFGLTGKETTSVYPNICLYNDTADSSGHGFQEYTLAKDMNNTLTMIGDFKIGASDSAKSIMGKVTAYGDLTVEKYVKFASDTSDDYCNLYVEGDLVLGSASGGGNVTVNRDIYCEQSVTIYSNVSFGAGCDIYSEGNVTLINATVRNIYCTNGTVSLENSTSNNISTQGAVKLTKNSTVNGTVYCGKLDVENSSILGNIKVQSISLQQNGTEIMSGDMTVIVTSEATASSHKEIGNKYSPDKGCIYVDGNLKISRQYEFANLSLYGNIQVNGALLDPGYVPKGYGAGSLQEPLYPYYATIYGDLIVNGGSAASYDNQTYIVNYLVGLRITGDAWFNWSVPVFTVGSSSWMEWMRKNLMNELNQTSSWKLDAAYTSEVKGTLYVCDNSSSLNNKAGNFAFSIGEDADFFGSDDLATNSIRTPSSINNYICLRNATLNNVRVGATGSYYDMAVWGGTIKGSILARNIRLAGITFDSSENAVNQCIYAKASNGSYGSLSIRSITNVNVSFQGELWASQDMVIGAAVELADSGKIVCARNLYINGNVSGKVVVGSSESKGGYVYVSGTSNLKNADPAKSMDINGSLKVEKSPSGNPTRNKIVYVTGAMVDLEGKMSTLYYSANTTLTSSSPRYSSLAHQVGATDVYDLSAYQFVNVTQSGGVDNETTKWLHPDASTQITKPMINTTKFESVWYIQTNTTVTSDLLTVGVVLVKSGVTLTVNGNMRCARIATVTDQEYANYMSSSSYLRDQAGQILNVNGLTVDGDLEIDVASADCIMQDCTIGGSLYVTSQGTLTLDHCTVANSTFVVGVKPNSLPQAGNLVLRNNTTIGDADASVDSLKTSNLVYCRDLDMDNSTIYGNVYAQGSKVDISLSAKIAYSLYAVEANVSLSGASQICYKSNADLDVELRTVIAYTFKSSTDSWVGSTDRGQALVYLSKVTLPGDTPNALNANGLDTICTAGNVRLYGSGTPVHRYSVTNGQIADSSTSNTEVGDKMVQYYINEAIDAHTSYFAWPDNAQNRVSMSYMHEDFANMSSWDREIKPTITLGVIDNPGSSLVQYTDLSNNPHMMMGNDNVWTPSTIALEWVFPLLEEGLVNSIKAATADGEQVYVNNKSDGDITMSVYYTSISTTIFDGMWNTLRTGLDNILKELDLNRVGPWLTDFSGSVSKLFHYLKDEGGFSTLMKASRSTSGVGYEYGFYNGKGDDASGLAATDGDGRYIQSKAGAEKLNQLRVRENNPDMIVVSGLTRKANTNLAAYLNEHWGWFGSVANWLTGNLLTGISWPGDKIYVPSGIFFFESGYVPEEVFNSYKDYSHNADSCYKPSYSYYRSDYTEKESRDGLGRWLWGGNSHNIIKDVTDCTWTFYTCTDITDPYGPNSKPKDLHIVLPKHTYLAWQADGQNSVRIIGDGRVFLYLQEDTNILIAGADKDNENIFNVFGGLRTVELNADGTTKYVTNESGEKTGVYLDSTAANTGLQPRMFIIGTGPNIHLEIRDFEVAAYIYMPNGQSYIGDKNAYTSTTYGKKYSKDNIIYLSSTSASNKDISIHGMYVADKLSTSPMTVWEDESLADSKIKFYKTQVDLSNTVIYYRNEEVTTMRQDGMYRLAEFWRYPSDMDVSDVQFFYNGVSVD